LDASRIAPGETQDGVIACYDVPALADLVDRSAVAEGAENGPLPRS
jgi:hypothetical protein